MLGQPLMEVYGKPALGKYGFIAPGFFGRTKLTLTENSVVEETKRIIATRKCEVILSEVDSVEIVENGNPLLLTIGFMTLFYLVGIIFFILYFVFKNQYLIVRSASNIQAVSITNAAMLEKAKAFMDKTLVLAQAAKV